ncbi:HNH endonuclease [Streptomyces sp. NPDC057757]|uniref:HNH endonuclease n=1 Tax=Streptomyces sp. NPDC057757 TaxID=3346241 RepID=UPI0036C96334
MSLHEKPHLNSKRRRNRKARLAERDGQRCTWCRRPFASLREATLDHVVPISLLWTWSADYLVLACRPCNNRKADQFPLSLALLIAWSADPSRPTVAPVDWSLLARLAYAHQSTFAAVWSPDPIGHRSPRGLQESTPHSRARSACGRPVRGTRPTDHPIMRRPSIRPDCLRAPRSVRVCVRPSGEGVVV